jgi:hypothetical protein
MAANGTSTSSGQGWTIFTPKPPPTSGAMQSTDPSSRSSIDATAARTPDGVWVDE